MPIKPENRGRYPKNWKEIRERILKRAENRCEKCLVLNHTLIARGLGNDAGTYMTWEGEVHDDQTGKYLGMARGSEYVTEDLVKIVLTISHTDHTPENCDDSNLRALCQKCHLDHDRPHHQKVRAATARAKKAVTDFFTKEDKE